MTQHRIIRHGTTYGPLLPEGILEDDGAEHGIFFILAWDLLYFHERSRS